MDKSEKYFTMCKKANEIQEQWHIELGDEYADAGGYSLGPGTSISSMTSMKDRCVWLPRQDQLQEMVIRYGKDIKPEWFPCLLYVVDFFLKPYAIECERSTGYPFPETMEQMWLSFVMKDKYGKVWTGKSWKKVDKIDKE